MQRITRCDKEIPEFDHNTDYWLQVYKRCKKYEDLLFTPEQVQEMFDKVEKQEEELIRWHTEERNENIKNEFANSSTLICHNCNHKDEYIEDLQLEVAELKKKVPPCNVGDIVYKVIENEIKEFKIDQIRISSFGMTMSGITPIGEFCTCTPIEFETGLCCLSQEKAEQAVAF